MKLELMDAQKARFPVRFMCQQLGVSRSGYYAWQGRPESARQASDRVLAEVVLQVHHDSRRTYGSPRVHAELRARGQRVSRKRVVRLMREQGLAARRRRRYVATTDSRHRQPVAPNVLARDFSPAHPNSTWATDITYVGTREGWLYLAVVSKPFSRKVVGWSMSETIDRHLVLAALDMALKGRQPPRGLVHHSDRGSQYASEEYQQALAARGIECSMSRKGNALDNAVVESFFKHLEARTRLHHGLHHASASTTGALRVHRGLLQPAAAALDPGLCQPPSSLPQPPALNRAPISLMRTC